MQHIHVVCPASGRQRGWMARLLLWRSGQPRNGESGSNARKTYRETLSSTRIAGFLVRELPDDVGLMHLHLYPEGEGASSDPRVITVSWRVAYRQDNQQGRDDNWGDQLSERLASALMNHLSSTR